MTSWRARIKNVASEISVKVWKNYGTTQSNQMKLKSYNVQQNIAQPDIELTVAPDNSTITEKTGIVSIISVTSCMSTTELFLATAVHCIYRRPSQVHS
jgi:hypothetical protein